MNIKGKYEPEDLESLLMEKDFASLYPEEREYVLRHMSDEEEYAEIRDLLLNISQDSDEAEMISPPTSMKQDLMDQHKAYHSKPSFTIWLNSVFAMFRIPEHMSGTALQFASLIAVVMMAWWLIPGTGKQEMAVHTEPLREVSTEKNALEEPIANGLDQEENTAQVDQSSVTEDAKFNLNEGIPAPTEIYEIDVQEKPSLAKVQPIVNEDMNDNLQADEAIQPQETSIEVTKTDDYSTEVFSEIVVREESSQGKKKELFSRSEKAPVSVSMDKRKDMASSLPSTKVNYELISLLYTTW